MHQELLYSGHFAEKYLEPNRLFAIVSFSSVTLSDSFTVTVVQLQSWELSHHLLTLDWLRIFSWSCAVNQKERAVLKMSPKIPLNPYAFLLLLISELSNNS